MAKDTPVVFISSTKEDLEAYRNAARRAVSRAGFLALGMEDFVAEGQNPPYAECMAKVGEADVLVVIVAHRYGWVPPDQPAPGGKSITWLECERARRRKKEVLAFLVDEKAEWAAELKESYRLSEAAEEGKCPPELVTEVNRNVAKLKELKRWLSSLGIRATFTNPDGLRAEVEAALNDWLKRQGGPVAAVKAPEQDPVKYLQWLRQETAWIDIRGLQVGSGKAHRFPIEDLYIPLTTAEGEGKERAPSKEMRAPVRLEEALRHRRLVIVGDPGSGKTTFLLRVAYEMSRAGGESKLKLPTGAFPILVRVAELEQHILNCERHPGSRAPTTIESPSWLLHFLENRGKQLGWDVDADFFKERLAERSTYVLLDGLDETPSRVQRESMARLFERTTRAYRKCRFVVTTRPQAYTGESTLAGFHSLRIEDLPAEAVEGFLGHWSRCLYPDDPARAEGHRKELVEALHARVEIRRMARNPLMLTALAVLHWNERRLPERRADLYESIVKWLAQSRERRPGREPADRCLVLLGRLALEMQKAPQGRLTQVPRGRAAEMIAGQFRESDEGKRFRRARSFLDQDEVDSGIIVSRGSELRFWHLTLQEYLAARFMAGLREATQQKLLLTDGRLYRPEWREVVLLLGGVLLVRQGAEKIDGLFGGVLDSVWPAATLAEKARCAGLLGAMLADLRPTTYQLADRRYEEILEAVLGIFDAEKSKGIDLGVRLEAAEALGQAGDPRLRRDNWVTIPAGTFLMGAQDGDPAKPNYDRDAYGDESPVHEVELKAYQIGRYPVTVEEYRRFIEDDGDQKERWRKGGRLGKRTEPDRWEEQVLHPNRPVVNVTWYEAAAYCAWAGGRLPTEAEWERAARGTDGRKYPWGPEPPDSGRANYGQTRVGSPTPVGLFPQVATPDGIHDMAGNVWEWVADRYAEHYYGRSPRENPSGSKRGRTRVVRGGCWFFGSGPLRAAFRVPIDPRFGLDEVGFHCAREIIP